MARALTVARKAGALVALVSLGVVMTVAGLLVVLGLMSLAVLCWVAGGFDWVHTNGWKP